MKQSRLQYFFILIITIAITINIIQFKSIDDKAPNRFSALYNYEESNIYKIAFSEDGTQRKRHSLSYDIGKVSDGANFIQPEGFIYPGGIRAGGNRLFFLGKINNIEELSYDSMTFLSMFDPTPYIVKANDSYPKDQQYRIAINNSNIPVSEFILLFQEDEVLLLLDTYLLSDEMYGLIEELRR